MMPFQLPENGMRIAGPSEKDLLALIATSLDAMLQLQARIAIGWDAADAIADMGLTVKPIPEKPTETI
jgi:hypothetical protein